MLGRWWTHCLPSRESESSGGKQTNEQNCNSTGRIPCQWCEQVQCRRGMADSACIVKEGYRGGDGKGNPIYKATEL